MGLKHWIYSRFNLYPYMGPANAPRSIDTENTRLVSIAEAQNLVALADERVAAIGVEFTMPRKLNEFNIWIENHFQSGDQLRWWEEGDENWRNIRVDLETNGKLIAWWTYAHIDT